MHVTFRVRKDVPGLRRKRLVREFRRSLAKACERGRFRVVHYSIQPNHVHLLVEAQGKDELASGMKSVAARFARAVNRVFSRSGPVLEGHPSDSAAERPIPLLSADPGRRARSELAARDRMAEAWAHRSGGAARGRVSR